MAPRPRRKGNKDLPVNLYAKHDKRTNKTYYQYRDPRTGIFHGLGSEKAAAIEDACQMNALLYAAERASRIEAITETAGRPFNRWISEYWERWTKRKEPRETTKRTRGYITTMLANHFGSIPINSITVQDCDTVLEKYIAAGKDRMAQSVRSVMIDVFKYAKASGIVDDNPALATLPPSVSVKRARLTLEHFQAIFTAAEHLDPWIQNSMLLAMVTGQRREDLSRLKFKDVKGDWLEIVQGKTGKQLRISLDLRLDAIGMSVGEVIARCRDRVVSPYILHHTKTRTKSRPGDPVHKDTLSRRFADARKLSGLSWEGDPPTFHEMRSLAGRLYKKEGLAPKELFGHSEEKMTDVYLNDRGHDWTEISK